jgi:glutamyl-tRNA synthetase
LRERSKRLTDLVDTARYFFLDPDSYEEKASRKHFTREAVERLEQLRNALGKISDFGSESVEKVFRDVAESIGISAGKLIHPVRLAVSGVSFGPGLFDLLETLGSERVLKRIKMAITHIRNMKS